MTIGVSIILATYNRAHLILETLESIQNQTYRDWECLIIDDGATDDTQEVLAPILERDTRFQFLKRPNTYLKGLPGCRNFGLDLAKGAYILFFDDDDVVHPQNLELALQGIELNSSDFCLYQKQSFEEKQEFVFDNEVLRPNFQIDQKDIERIITNNIPMASCTVLWRKKSLSNQRFNEQLLYAEEWEFYTRLVASGLKGIAIDNILYFNRKHPQSNTGEFYTKDPVRRASKKVAIELMVQNLHKQGLLSRSILRYLIQLSLGFRDFNLFDRILFLAELTTFERYKWVVFYHTLPIRLGVIRLKKAVFND